jgi:hypothetical protein
MRFSTRYFVFEEVAPDPGDSSVAGEVTDDSLVKSISSGGEYVTLQKYFSHPSLDIHY